MSSKLITPTTPMRHALEQAQTAFHLGEVPVGAVIVEAASNRIITAAHNLTETRNDPTAHAEMLAIRDACRLLSTRRLAACDIYVTLEPCAMCAQAIAFARLRRLYFGAYDVKGGGVEHGPRLFSQPTCHHAPEVIGGVEENAAAQMLKLFFKQRR